MAGKLSQGGTAVLVAEPSIAAMRAHIDRGYVLVRGRIAAVSEDGGPGLDRLYQEKMGIQRT